MLYVPAKFRAVIYLGFLSLFAVTCLSRAAEEAHDQDASIESIQEVAGHMWSWKHDTNQHKNEWIIFQKGGTVASNWIKKPATWEIVGLREVELSNGSDKTTIRWNEDFSSFFAKGLKTPSKHVTGKIVRNKAFKLKSIHDVVGHKWSWEHNGNRKKNEWIVLQKNGVALTNWNKEKVTWNAVGLREVELSSPGRKTTLKWKDDFSSFAAQGLNDRSNYVTGKMIQQHVP